MSNEKNQKRPRKVLIENGRVLCPYCRGYQGTAYYGATASKIDLMCRNDRCKRTMRFDI